MEMDEGTKCDLIPAPLQVLERGAMCSYVLVATKTSELGGSEIFGATARKYL